MLNWYLRLWFESKYVIHFDWIFTELESSLVDSIEDILWKVPHGGFQTVFSCLQSQVVLRKLFDTPTCTSEKDIFVWLKMLYLVGDFLDFGPKFVQYQKYQFELVLNYTRIDNFVIKVQFYPIWSNKFRGGGNAF